jgi:hypothetical protein
MEITPFAGKPAAPEMPADVARLITALYTGDGESAACIYSAAMPAARAPADYTARVIPCYDGVAIPLEDAQIVCEK